MKKRFLLFLSLFSIQIGFTQVNNSVLSSGDWYKFSVDTTGVFKIDRNLLQQIGISTSGLNPKKIHIYGNGGQLLPDLNSDFRFDDLQENSIYIEGENDGTFDSSDYILFYAKGPHSWDVNPSTNTAKHKQNIYSDKGYYFITVNDVDGKRIQQKTPITTNSIAQISVFDDYIFYEKEEKSILAVGTQWFFNEDFNIENTQNFSIPFPNAISNQNINVRVRGVSNSVVSSTMDVKINGQDVYTINYPAVNSGSLTKAFASERNADILYKGNSLFLTQGEYEVLKELVKNDGNVISKEQLLYSTPSITSLDGKSLEMIISKIRQKMIRLKWVYSF